MNSVAEKSEVASEMISAAEFAEIIVGSRREAIGLSVDRIQQLAGCVLVLDHQLGQANLRMASMMINQTEAPTSVTPGQAGDRSRSTGDRW